MCSSMLLHKFLSSTLHTANRYRDQRRRQVVAFKRLRWLNTVLVVCEYICHLPNHGKRRVAAHKLKLERNMKDFDWQVEFRSFRSFHGNMNDWIKPKLKWPQEKLKTMLMQNFGVTKKEHYGIMAFSGPIIIWVMLQTWKSTPSCNLQLSVNLFSVLSHGQLVFEWNKLNRPTATQVRINTT